MVTEVTVLFDLKKEKLKVVGMSVNTGRNTYAKNINKVSLKILPLLSPKLWKALVHKALRDSKTFTLLSPDYHVLSPKSLKGGVICRNFKQFDAPGGGKISRAAFATFGRLPLRAKTLIQTGNYPHRHFYRSKLSGLSSTSIQ